MVLGNLGYNLDGRRVYAICNAFFTIFVGVVVSPKRGLHMRFRLTRHFYDDLKLCYQNGN